MKHQSSPTMTKVTVTAPARLHLGFLDLNGGLGRKFGSIGLAISSPRTRLTIGFARRGEIVGPESERMQSHFDTLQRSLGLDGSYRVEVGEAIPAHAGLGSGTQLALALAAGVRRLHGLPLDLRGDAVRLRRGARSGVGIGLFAQGGLVVDGGHGANAGPAPIISRIPFPEHWRVLIVLDPARQGLHGTPEGEAFAALPPMPELAAAKLCRLALMKLLPALVERDLPGFGAAVKDMQQLLGDHFAPMQGGSRFTSPQVGACLQALDRAGAYGVGQSSWGPTGFAFAASPGEADRLAMTARRYADDAGLDIRICTGLNEGADISARMTADAPL
ncbi:MAG: beta-ribofuranosylaminobenzene 5'-phosphate synthase family protein [Xanthobacteraceae bacterium]